MNKTEEFMKLKGESNIWKDIVTKNDKPKNISSTQIGQKLLMNESVRIFEDVKDWIHNKSSKNDRKILKNYFNYDDILLDKIMNIMLLLSGNIYYNGVSNKKKANRHKSINIINRTVLDNIGFSYTWKFVEVIIHFSLYFEKITISDNESFKTHIKYSTTLSDTIISELSKKALLAFYPLPMKEKPIDWSFNEENGIVGGYESYQYEMIRAHKKTIDYNKYGQAIFDSINYIQSVSWRINKDVLKELKKNIKKPELKYFLTNDYPDTEPCLYSLRTDIRDLSEYSINKILKEGMSSEDIRDSFALSDKQIKKLNNIRENVNKKIKLYYAEVKSFESETGKYIATKMAIDIAEMYVDDIIYFPHNFDFRGRIYPISVGLNPQGSSQVKALIEYAEGEVLNEDGLKWMYAYLASLFGEDKLHFEDRVKRGMELVDTNYKEAEESYEFLAHQIELKKYLKDNTYKVKSRIHLDACNSGSQFSSAITGDLKGCYATNILPTFDENGNQVRKDAYELVSLKSLEKLEELSIEWKLHKEKSDMYNFFIDQMKKNGRKICKTPVMVSNYGGTAGGRTDIIWNLFRIMKVDLKWINRSVASSLSGVIGDSITGILNGGKAFEKYICIMNNMIAKDNEFVKWKTSDGFLVNHVKYKELTPKRVSCKLPNARNNITIIKKIYSKDNNVRKMRSAISPNYIHSLDAQLLRSIALRLKNLNIKNSDWIHDSFGCSPNNVDIMWKNIKEAFVKLMRSYPLDLLIEQLESQLTNIEDSDKVEYPIFNSFTEDQFKLMIKSEWSFS